MNPLTLLEAIGSSRFLMGLGLGLVVGVAGLIHRRGSAALVSLGLAAGFGVWLEGGSPASGEVSAVAGLVGGAWAGLVGVGFSLMSSAFGRGVSAVAFLLWVVGVWGTVPDTERSIILMGVVLAGLLGTIRADAPVWLAVVPLSTVVVWVALVDGSTRSSAPVGALAAAGLFVLLPLVDRLRRRPDTRLVLVAHVLIVVLSGRIAGRAETLGGALLAATAILIGTTAVLALSPRRDQSKAGSQ